MPAEAVLYTARPGLRLWKADISGAVQTTLIFTNSSAKPQMLLRNHTSRVTTETETETETETAAVDFHAAQFGLLRVYCAGLLVSYTSTDLLVVSPEEAKQIMFMYADNRETILDVAVNRDEIFVLRKPSNQHTRPLICLSQQPLCPRRFISPPTTMSTSCIYAEPYREFAYYNLYYVNAHTALIICKCFLFLFLFMHSYFTIYTRTTYILPYLFFLLCWLADSEDIWSLKTLNPKAAKSSLCRISLKLE